MTTSSGQAVVKIVVLNISRELRLLSLSVCLSVNAALKSQTHASQPALDGQRDSCFHVQLIHAARLGALVAKVAC